MSRDDPLEDKTHGFGLRAHLARRSNRAGLRAAGLDNRTKRARIYYP